MRVQILAGLAATTLLLAGCSGGSDDETPGATGPATSPTAVTTPTADPGDGGDAAAGDVDCSVFETDGVTTFIIWTQMFMQIREVDGLQTLSVLGYTPGAMSDMLDDLDQLKGIEGEVPGTPDEALANVRAANDIVAAAMAKGDAATDADLAGLDAIYPDADSWVSAQASITDSLNAACPDLGVA